MSSYGNPDKPNRYEQDASTVIHFIERTIAEHFRSKYGMQEHQLPGMRIDPQTYYASDGKSPCRFLFVYVTTPSAKRELRFGVQRNASARKWKWQLDFSDFIGGQRVNEYQHDATSPIDMKSLINSILIGYDFNR